MKCKKESQINLAFFCRFVNYKIPLNSHSLSVIAVIEAAKQFAGLK